MAPLINHIPALEWMKEIQHKCFKMGIPLKTWHREVTGQLEFAPEYGNLIVMQVIDEVVAKHGLSTLMQEKPFAGINGLGKHNN